MDSHPDRPLEGYCHDETYGQAGIGFKSENVAEDVMNRYSCRHETTTTLDSVKVGLQQWLVGTLSFVASIKRSPRAIT
jgi:hypothetical protein